MKRVSPSLNFSRHFSLICAVLYFCLSAALSSSHAAPPVVEKVEPPHWWARHSVNPVRLLIRGQNLTGAKARIAGAGVAAGKPKVNANGTYLQIEVTIAKNAAIGAHPLTIETQYGRAVAPFRVEKPLPRGGRFQGFGPDDVIYLVLPDRFTDGDPANNDPVKSRGLYDPVKTRSYHGGDFAGIRGRLPYLKTLGVTALWMTPIYDNSDRANPARIYDNQKNIDYHGYGATDYYCVEEHFGTLTELKALVNDAHRLGIKVIQDQVCNHVGEFHPWNGNAPTSTWLNGTKQKHLDCDWQILNLMNPNATPETQKATLDGWFAGQLPDMNQNDPEAAQYLIQNSLWWIGTVGFDGVRQDTVPYVPRRFWQTWTGALKREYPRLTILGEVLDHNPALTAFFQGGQKRFDGIDSGIDTVFDYPLHFALRSAFAGDQPNLRSIEGALASDWLYPNPSVLVNFLDLHDQPCFMSLKGATYARLRLAQTFLITVRGVPMLYYGDEIGLPGNDDPNNRRPFPGGFSGDSRNAFTAEGRSAEEQATFAHIQRLTRLRAALPALRHGKTRNLFLGDEQYVYARVLPNASPVLIGLNIAEKPVTLTIPVRSIGLKNSQRLTERLYRGVNATVTRGSLRLILPAQTSYVLSAP